jgi:Bacteriocin-protection, YdeI or OmpD-Associated
MRYTTTLGPLQGSKARVPVPFDPDEVWGTKREHHVGGTIAGVRVRGRIRKDDAGWGFSVSLCDRPINAGDVVNVVISPEGPQRWDLQPDFRAALEASPDAGAFFDSLAQFYRRGYLRWIDATKRRPDVRAERIAEVVRLLNAGVKERPKA